MHRSRHRRWWRHGARRRARGAPPKILSYVPRLRSADRKSLLLGTALASTLLISAVLTPTPASAVACIQPPSPNPINTNTVGDNQPIICVNTEPRTNPAGNAINLTTDGTGSYIDLSNSGVLSATNNNNSFMSASLPIPEAPTVRSPSRMLPPLPRPTPVPVMPWPFEPRPIAETVPLPSRTAASSTPILRVPVPLAFMRFTAALLVPGSNPISIVNSGNITVSGSAGVGISGFAVGVGYDSPLHIENTGDIAATGDQFAAGILAENGGAGGAITVENHGDIFARANSSFSGRARGIYVDAQGGSPVSVVNSGNKSLPSAMTSMLRALVWRPDRTVSSASTAALSR